MKELLVLGFASRELAEEARSLGAELDQEGVLQLDGAALASRRDDGRVELAGSPAAAVPRGLARLAVPLGDPAAADDLHARGAAMAQGDQASPDAARAAVAT